MRQQVSIGSTQIQGEDLDWQTRKMLTKSRLQEIVLSKSRARKLQDAGSLTPRSAERKEAIQDQSYSAVQLNTFSTTRNQHVETEANPRESQDLIVSKFVDLQSSAKDLPE